MLKFLKNFFDDGHMFIDLYEAQHSPDSKAITIFLNKYYI